MAARRCAIPEATDQEVSCSWLGLERGETLGVQLDTWRVKAVPGGGASVSNDAGFEALYRRHAPRVLAYVRRRIDDPESAADVAAEVFTVAWRRLADVPEPALPWLLGVARRQLANHHRARRRRLALVHRIAGEPARPVANTPTIGDTQLATALGSLSSEDTELLLLIGWDGLRPAEAAEVLGMGAATVRTRLHRARRRLDEALQSEEDLA